MAFDLNSHNYITHTNTHAFDHNAYSFNSNSFNHDLGSQESYNHDSAFTHTEQSGLLNINASPAFNAPIHHNDVHVSDLF
jgi:hypothetical protein